MTASGTTVPHAGPQFILTIIVVLDVGRSRCWTNRRKLDDSRESKLLSSPSFRIGIAIKQLFICFSQKWRNKFSSQILITILPLN
jgi:hypothetical protein